ncbi:MAG: NAD-binding protein [Actinomycetota bacterium]|nr:NAD-binding protein [Actinomycetota bacterium]
MRIIVAGGGMVGRYLLDSLRQDHQVTVIEKRVERVAELKEWYPNENILHGDSCEPYVLDDARMPGADAVAAVTGDDEDNLVISYLSKFEYGVPMVFSRVNNPKNGWLFTPDWGVDQSVCSASIIVQLVQGELTLGEMVTLLKLETENVVVEEVVLKEGSKMLQKSLKEIPLPQQSLVATVIRDGSILIPRGDLILEAGDRVLLIAAEDKAQDLKDLLR